VCVTVGIPRALAYYDYYSLWEVFFSSLGIKPVISPPTNQAILNEGVRRAVDGTCLPVKIFYGHVQWLIEAGVDHLFLPRIVSVAPREYICPKFMGLPDMMTAVFRAGPRAWCPTIDLNRSVEYVYGQIEELGRTLGYSSRDTHLALQEGLKAQSQTESYLQAGYWPTQDPQCPWEQPIKRDVDAQPGYEPFSFPDLCIGLLGHSYLIYDEFANMQIVARLRAMGAEIRTVDMLSQARLEARAEQWPKRMFWTSGRRILGAASEYMEVPVAGIVYITAFGCGTDSLTAELVERTIRRQSKIPQLILNLDEHTGEAGVVTRLEAFVDMLRWRQSR